MPRMQIELSDEVFVEAKRRAEDRGLSITSFVTGLVEQEIGLVERETGKGWPSWFFEEVVGGWQGEFPERPEEPR